VVIPAVPFKLKEPLPTYSPEHTTYYFRFEGKNAMNAINTIMDVVAAKKGGEFGFNLWLRKCAECLKFIT
jgi:hypothetical protein